MLMLCNLEKCHIYPVHVSEDKVFVSLSESDNEQDITADLTSSEATYIRHFRTGIITAADNKRGFDIAWYVSTHTHSEYSILDGMSKIKDIAKTVTCAGALTDHGNMFGFLKFFKAMEAVGKVALIGSEVYVSRINESKEGNHLILIAMNEEGKRNLFQLSSLAYENFYKKPHVSFEMLRKYSAGLICTSACLGGEVAVLLARDDYDGAKQVAMMYKEIFKDNYYLEIQRHDIDVERKVNDGILRLSKELDIHLVAANDSHYILPEHASIHEYLLCINDKKKMNEHHRKFDGTGYYLMSQQEMADRFWDIPEAIQGTIEIALKCNLKIETGKYHLPVFEIPDEYDNEIVYLEHLIDEGFQKRYAGTELIRDKVRLERLAYEKGVIFNMGYAAYFLIVWDYVHWAKSQGIMVGPGRGSAAGSLVSYCLEITDLDPIPYDLLFERFLNPDRVSMPDIDMDFEYTRRGEVIEYLKRKYGSDRVCNIITFGTMAAKQVIKDVARVDDEYELSLAIAKAVPSEPGMTITNAMQDNPELLNMYNSNGKAREIIETGKILEGNTRQTGVHACGIVVAPDSVRNFLPTAIITKKVDGKKVSQLASQVTMTEVEDLGLLKMDFLGLRTMSVIGWTLRDLNKKRRANGLKEFDNYRQIPLNDPYVYADIAQGRSYAVFQIESPGMRKFMTELYSDVAEKIANIERKYSCSGFRIGDDSAFQKELEVFGNELFDRMIAGVALYRPGPMDYIPDYIKGMLNPGEIEYDTPALEPVLKPTYGIIVYQEQVMQIVRILAGFSNGQSDTIRKAMGKKKQAILDEYKPFFIYGSGDEIDSHTGNPYGIVGCVANGIPESVAEKIWDKMKDFAKYAFNKSHAAVYAVLTIVCAWQKKYYPVEFMSETINSVADNAQKMKEYISVAKRMKIPVLRPDVNKSNSNFLIEGNAIRFGLVGIKGWNKTVDALILERERGGEFIDVQDFTERMLSASSISKSDLISLIYCGALDSFEGSRAAKLSVVEVVLKASANIIKDRESGQLSLFDINDDMKGLNKVSIPRIPELPKLEMLEKEKEYAGFYVTEHPLDSYSDTLADADVASISNILSQTEDDTEAASRDLIENVQVQIAGIIKSVRTVYTKKDKLPMCTFEIEDDAAEISGVIFNRDYERLHRLVTEGAIVVVQGNISLDENFGTQIITQAVILLDKLDNVRKKTASQICVRLEDRAAIPGLLTLIRRSPGAIPVLVQVDRKLYRLEQTATASSGLYMTLLNLYGSDNVMFR